MTQKSLISVCVTALLTLLVTATYVSAAPPADLMVGKTKSIEPGAYGKQAIEGRVDVSGPATGRQVINLKLPDGSKVRLERTGFEARTDGDALWIGRVADQPDSEVSLTVAKGQIAGRVSIGSEVFEILPGKGGKTIVTAIDLNALPACDVDDSHVISEASQPIFGGSVLAATANAGTVVNDILVVYTAPARAAVGDASAMAAYAQAMIDSTNTAFSESNMNVRFRLVHAEEISYTTAGTTSDDLDWVRLDAGVGALRDLYGADMVSLIVDTPSSCGTAFVQRTPASWFESYAFAATDVGCALGGLAFAHEHGHNMGMEHNFENSSVGNTPEDASYLWSFAHYVDGSFRTIMSYSNPCTSGCSKAARFSNPDILFNGLATGISDTRDNARTGDLTSPIIADFRSTVVGDDNPGPVIHKRVSQPSDDAEESISNGTVYLHSNDLEIGYDGSVGSDVHVGLRFTDLAIPNGATITNAWLEFTADEVRSGITDATIRAQDADNPASFNALTTDISSRGTTTALVTWNSIPAWDTVGATYQSPDISPIVQEVVDRSGWSAGNAMAFVITATGRRNAYSWDGDPLRAPLLHVEYATVQSVTIDVLPGDAANVVYPNMGGKLPVAIISSPDFDATQIDPNTLKFGANEAIPSEAVQFLDLDSQHTLDAQTRFAVPDTGIACNDTEVSLLGETLSGDSFVGVDTIDATQCVAGGCHAY